MIVVDMIGCTLDEKSRKEALSRGIHGGLPLLVTMYFSKESMKIERGASKPLKKSRVMLWRHYRTGLSV